MDVCASKSAARPRNMTWSISLLTSFLLVTVLLPTTNAAALRPLQDRYNQHEGDSVRIEWDVDHSGSAPGYLLFYHHQRHLLTVILSDNDYTLEFGDLDQNHYSFSNPKTYRFGILVKSMRLDESGIYTCIYSNTSRDPGVIDHPSRDPGNIHTTSTLFIYTDLQKPLVTPDGPLMAGRDVTLTCVTSSTSQPPSHRPAILVTWYEDELEVPNGPRVKDGRLLVPRSTVDSGRVSIYACKAKEEGSDLRQFSLDFPLIILSMTPTTKQLLNLPLKSDATLSWRLSPTSQVEVIHNRTMSFTLNGEKIAQFNLLLHDWTASDWRLHWYNPRADVVGIQVRSVEGADAGYYGCYYSDEYGTHVEGALIPMSILGQPFPTTTTTTIASTRVTSGNTPGGITMAPVTLPTTENAKLNDQTIIILAVLMGAILLVVTIVVAVVLVRRKMKKKKKAVTHTEGQQGEPQSEVVMRYTARTGSMTSVYSTLRESMMVSDDVMKESPSLPPRDDTYNQPFEATRPDKVLTEDVESSYLTMDDHLRRQNSYTNGPEVASSSTMCKNTEANASRRPLREENEYLIATNTKPRPSVPTCPQREENEYLTPISIKQPPKYT